jgi:hypothetical protein
MPPASASLPLLPFPFLNLYCLCTNVNKSLHNSPVDRPSILEACGSGIRGRVQIPRGRFENVLEEEEEELINSFSFHYEGTGPMIHRDNAGMMKTTGAVIGRFLGR